jgi:hypothetical protein
MPIALRLARAASLTELEIRQSGKSRRFLVASLSAHRRFPGDVELWFAPASFTANSRSQSAWLVLTTSSATPPERRSSAGRFSRCGGTTCRMQMTTPRCHRRGGVFGHRRVGVQAEEAQGWARRRTAHARPHSNCASAGEGGLADVARSQET